MGKREKGNALCTNEFFSMVYTIFPFSYDHNQQAWEIVFIPHNYMFRLKTHIM